MSPRPCKPSWSEPPFVSFCQLHYIHAQAQPVSRVVLPWAVSRTLVPPIVGSLQVDSGKMLSNDWLLTLPKLEQPRCHSNTRPSMNRQSVEPVEHYAPLSFFAFSRAHRMGGTRYASESRTLLLAQPNRLPNTAVWLTSNHDCPCRSLRGVARPP
ncbi:hypothetical protein T4C_12547 [Trichinella pseudospiralis]|uniref:Uncharacterized protein n=1 Tax=Trichinella pseudospiralis TaxID=6337 RepID=A0A0V1J7P6_TRIPS|nr:hypothetical protein T4C_12547 [Trichinella pseudospiralis]